MRGGGRVGFLRRARRALTKHGGPRLGGVRERRQVTVEDGPGRGLLLDLAGASADYADGRNELPVQNAVVDGLHPGDVFVDVGANIGYFSLLAARKVGPEGRVIAVEAVSELATAVRANAQLNGFSQVEVVDAAASDSVGEVELMLAEHPGGATISSADTPPDLVGRRTVRTVTLDSLWADGRRPAPTLVKIDVEGAELPVLRGMAGLLRTHAPRVLCELDSSDRGVLDRKVAEFRSLMADHDYIVEDLEASYEGAAWHVYHAVARPSDRHERQGLGQRSGV
jgi:FkbM family methyltransferase